MKKSSMVFSIFLFFITSSIVSSQSKPIQLALFNPVQIFDESNAIAGLRLNLIYGRNTSVTGVDFGLVNATTSGTSVGLQWGFVNLNDGNFTGIQLGTVHWNKGKSTGFHFGIVNHAGTMSGVQLGFVNLAGSVDGGLQIGLVNVIEQGGMFPFFPIVNWSF
jgi:hypothetical protein